MSADRSDLMADGRLSTVLVGVASLLIFLSCLIARAVPEPATAGEKIFIIDTKSTDLDGFRAYAKLAAGLKPHGRVQVIISTLADKSWYEFPEGGSPWHEYGDYTAAPWKFFPHPKIAPYLPADWVASNRKLLLAKAAVLREMGLEAAVNSRNSTFLPESFFRQYPHLRGPRVDHPRRSKEEAFAWCVDLPETQEMIEWMMAEFKRNVPEIRTVFEGTNDAGSGLCWAAALYSGPNGPRHCRNINAGERVRDLCLHIHNGARTGGGDIVLRWGTMNLWDNEEDVILPMLPPDTYINRRDPSFMSVGTMSRQTYPFLGIIDPLAVITAMERYSRPGTGTVSLDFSVVRRADEIPETASKLFDLMEDCIKEPTDGLSRRLEKLRKIAARWGGEKNAEKVFEAFYDMHQAFDLKSAVAPDYNNYYCGVSMRLINRPLVIKPELLSPEDESYFLPYVFNIHENEARMDYIDFHGGRMDGTSRWDDRGLNRAFSLALGAAQVLENLEGAPEGEWLKRMALSLRMWVCEVRSMHNFYHGQLIRDKYAAVLAGEPRIPEKVGSRLGDKGNLEWNEIMRAELDNTNELIAMLGKEGGLKLTALAVDKRHEDTFLLGPDLVDQLKKKASIMRDHWLDIEQYLAPPHK